MPSIAHFIYIPGILLLGFALGFRFGAHSAREHLKRELEQRKR